MTEPDAATLLDDYLSAHDRTRFARMHLADAPPHRVREISTRAARRFLERTLTLRELQGFARDIASAQETPETSGLIGALGPSLPHCCARNAHAVAKAGVKEWLGRVETPVPED